MNASIRITVAVLSAVLVVALIAWARGHPHHHGTEVGSLRGSPHMVHAPWTNQARSVSPGGPHV